MHKVAIPVSGNVLSENFKDCSYYQIFEIDDQGIITNKDGMLPQSFLKMLPILENNYDITDIIVHAIDQDSLGYIKDSKINLFIGVNIESPIQLINAYLEGTLKSNTLELTPKDKVLL